VPSLLAVVALVDLLEPAVMPTARCCPVTVVPLLAGFGLVLVGVDTLSPPVTTLPAVGSGGGGIGLGGGGGGGGDGLPLHIVKLFLLFFHHQVMI
tara:strand:- start:308 stop:592 length:285 start_codon:yes stop_codon:yes gene_type:complete